MKTRMFYFLSFFIAAMYACSPGSNKISGINFSSTTTPTVKETVFQLTNEDSPSYSENRSSHQTFSNRTNLLKKPVVSKWEEIQQQYKVPLVQFKIAPDVADTLIYLPSGTQLIIPQYAFEQNGKVITDSVNIEYREFHSIKDIFFSGINMEYLMSDEKNIFESNGMYELKVSYHNQPAEIVDIRPIQINMTLNGSNEGYNYYTLNQTNNVWAENKEAIVETKNEEKYFTEEIVYEKPSLGIKILDKSGWNKYTWGKAEDTYFEIVFNPLAYPELSKFEHAVFQVHQTTKEFTTSMGLNYATKKNDKNATEYILCNEMLITAVKEKPGYIDLTMKSKDFNERFESIIYIPEQKTENDFIRTLIAFEASQKAELFNRNSKREKILHEHTNYNYVPTKTAQTQNLINEATRFEAPIYASSPGIGNWDKPYPFLGPPTAGERQIIANIKFEDNHADVGRVFVADVTKNRLVPVSEKQEGKYRFNIGRDAEMMLWTVDEFGNAGIIFDTEINIDDLNKRPLIELPVYTAEELVKKLDLFGGKILDNKTAEATTTIQ